MNWLYEYWQSVVIYTLMDFRGASRSHICEGTASVRQVKKTRLLLLDIACLFCVSWEGLKFGKIQNSVESKNDPFLQYSYVGFEHN